VQGRRDYAVLLFLYNTGARATEVAEVQVGALSFHGSPSVRLLGTGGKVRYCPLWATTTVPVLTRLVAGRRADEAVFLNRSHQPLTRFGIRTLVKRYADKARHQLPSLRTKSVTTHTIRHYLPFLTMSCNGEPPRIWIGDFRSCRAKPWTSRDIVLCRLQAVQKGGESIAESSPGYIAGHSVTLQTVRHVLQESLPALATELLP